MTAFWTALAGLGLADSLNPFSIAAMIYLLGAQHAIRQGAIFIAGTFAAYLLGGVLLQFGVFQRLLPYLPLQTEWFVPLLQLLGGLLCIALGAWLLRRNGQGKAPIMPSSMGDGAVLGFAVSSTFADLTSALPYFAALGLISGAGLHAWRQGVALLVYNVIYCLPLLALLLLRVWRRAGEIKIFSVITNGVNWMVARLVPGLTLVLGLVLAPLGAAGLVSAS